MGNRGRTAVSRRGRGRSLVATLLPLLLAANACQAHDPTPAATGGPLIAYTLPKSTPWFQAGDVSFVLAQGKTPIKTWTKQMDASRLGGLTSPAFTTDCKHAFAQYADEEAGRYPYDGGDIKAQLVWVDIASRQIHEAAIPARSRTSSHQPGTYRDYPLPNGEAVVVAKPSQSPGQSSTATGLFIRQNDQLVHVADVEATAVAVA